MVRHSALIPDSELPGETMTPDHVAEASDTRSAMSTDQRVRQWELDAEARETADRSQIGNRYGILIVGGEKEDGKSLVVFDWARHHWRRGGYVFSNTSSLFGQRLDASEMARFADHIPRFSFIVVDEAHIVFNPQASAKIDLLLNGFSLARKNQAIIALVSTSEYQIHPGIRSEAQTVLYPQPYPSRYWPKKFIRPGWCYKWPIRIGPYPYLRHRRVADDYGVARKGGKPRVRRMRRPPSPISLYNTAKVYDSWAQPLISEGLGLTANQLRRDIKADDDGYDQGQDGRLFFRALAAAEADGHIEPSTTYGWQFIDGLARDYGWSAHQAAPAKPGLKILQRYTHMSGSNRLDSDHLDLAALLGGE